MFIFLLPPTSTTATCVNTPPAIVKTTANQPYLASSMPTDDETASITSGDLNNYLVPVSLDDHTSSHVIKGDDGPLTLTAYQVSPRRADPITNTSLRCEHASPKKYIFGFSTPALSEDPHSSLANGDDDNSGDTQLSVPFIYVYLLMLYLFCFSIPAFPDNDNDTHPTVWIPVCLGLSDDGHKHEAKCCRKTTTKFSVHFAPGKFPSHCNSCHY